MFFFYKTKAGLSLTFSIFSPESGEAQNAEGTTGEAAVGFSPGPLGGTCSHRDDKLNT